MDDVFTWSNPLLTKVLVDTRYTSSQNYSKESQFNDIVKAYYDNIFREHTWKTQVTFEKLTDEQRIFFEAMVKDWTGTYDELITTTKEVVQ